MKRYRGLDVLRGLGIMGVIFLHAALYHYAHLLEIDYEHPPLIVIVIGLLLTWAGLFAILSGTVHALQTVRRLSQSNDSAAILRGGIMNGLLMLALAYIYFLVLGPALLDRVHGNHDYSIIANLILRGKLIAPSLERILYIDTLIMIATNIIVCGLVLTRLWHHGLFHSSKRVSLILGLLATSLIAVSYIRIWLYPMLQQAIEQRNWWVMIALDYLANKNNPILPYLGFGLFGAVLGVRLSLIDDFRRATRPLILIASFLLIVGVTGYIILPDTMLQRDVDPLWFAMILAQIGLFLLLIVGFLRFFDHTTEQKRISRARKVSFIQRFGVAGLSVFLLETPFREIVGRFLSLVMPGWNDTIGAVILFGAALVIFWGIVLMLWERYDYAYSIERLLVWLMQQFGKQSSKLEQIQNYSGEQTC